MRTPTHPLMGQDPALKLKDRLDGVFRASKSAVSRDESCDLLRLAGGRGLSGEEPS